MAGKQAKTLSTADLNDLLIYASCTRHPVRNRVIVLLSAKAGLRAGEIANLTWDMVLDAPGQVSRRIELRDHAAKKCSGRAPQLYRIVFSDWNLTRRNERAQVKPGLPAPERPAVR